MTGVLTVAGVCVTRPGPAGPVGLLRDVSFTARVGELTLIIGPSGGGKSTLIRLLNRLDDPDCGQITLAGRDINSIDPLQLRRRVALVGQKPVMFTGSVLDNLQLPLHYQQCTPPAADDPSLLELLALCSLEPALLGRDAASLSLGQQQRVALARALVAAPDVLLLDEPTSALDRPTSDHLGETLRQIAGRRQLIVVMVTHDLRLAERHADMLVFLAAGEVLEQGPASLLLRAPASASLRDFIADPPRNGGSA